jgi:hypothetical protein
VDRGTLAGSSGDLRDASVGRRAGQRGHSTGANLAPTIGPRRPRALVSNPGRVGP